jgi:hypothetical protein
MNDFTLHGKLIDGAQSFEWIKDSLASLDRPASLCSAYIKLSILKEISSYTSRKEMRILARWDLNDLVGGASDIECYEFAKKNGWQFFINIRLHTKIYYLPPTGILIGSANATNSGLSLSPRSNREASTVVEINQHNLSFIDNLFKDSILLTDDIYQKLLDAYNKVEKTNGSINWPASILKDLAPKVLSNSKFMLNECLMSDGQEILSFHRANSDESINDLSMLAVPINVFDNSYIINKFIYSKIFLWTMQIIKENHGSISFGGLTHALHNALLEDPKPYRSEVKDLVKNVYSWIRLIGPEKTKIFYDRPSHSEVLRLLE